MKQQTKEMFKEYIKAKYNIPYFIEHFILVNNMRIKLKDYQKNLIKKLEYERSIKQSS